MKNAAHGASRGSRWIVVKAQRSEIGGAPARIQQWHMPTHHDQEILQSLEKDLVISPHLLFHAVGQFLDLFRLLDYVH